MQSVLVICEGNICRSPMAQGLLQAARPALRVTSAGLGALVGHPADATAIDLMKARGVDISAHRAVQITRQQCTEADLVLAMDATQKQRLQSLYPQVQGRVFRLGEFTRQDIPDPYRQDRSVFDRVLALIDAAAAEWLKRLDQL